MKALMSAAAVIAVAVLGSAGAFAQQVTLTPTNVVGGSAPYGSQFDNSFVLDKQTGSITEPDQNPNTTDGGYFLAPDAPGGTGVPDFIVIDLGAPYVIDYFHLFNTRNASYRDRGTGDFTITASNTLTDLTTGTNDQGTPIASGRLAAEDYTDLANDTLAAQLANVTSTTPYQYIRFNALNVAAVTPYGGNTIDPVGLNEIRVFQVPEPGSLALLGLGLCALARRRRM